MRSASDGSAITSDELQQRIATLHATFADKGIEPGGELLPPATSAELAQLREQVGPLHPDLETLWPLHGGQGSDDFGGTTGLFVSHALLSPAQAGEQHEMLVENWLIHRSEPEPHPPADDEAGAWSVNLTPFAGWDAYLLCMDATTGEVWEFYPNSGLDRHYPSLLALIDGIAERAAAIPPTATPDEIAEGISDDLLGPYRPHIT